MSASPLQLLVIEEGPATSSRIQESLARSAPTQPFQIKSVPTVRDAFFAMAEARPDLVLMEVSREDAPQFEAVARLHGEYPETPLLAVIDKAAHAYTLTIIAHGADNVLLKNHIGDATFSQFLTRSVRNHVAQKSIRDSEQHFRLMIENASDVITTLEPTGVIAYAGPSTERILHYVPADLTGRNFLDFVHRDDRRVFLDRFEKAFEKSGHLARVQYRFKPKEGEWLHLEGKGRIVRGPSAEPLLVMNSHDVSHRVTLENKLYSLSYRDELTGLNNRRSFLAVFDQQLKQATRAKMEGLYLLFIDLDKFKWINDNMGHKEGDNVLVAAARILQNTFREADVVARLGGDEFVVLLTESRKEIDIEMLKQRLFENLEEWNKQEERPYQLLMSVGVLFHNPSSPTSSGAGAPGPASVEELLLKADERMYQQKRARKQALSTGA